MRFTDEQEQELVDRVAADPDGHLLLGDTTPPRLGVEPYTIRDGTVMTHRRGLSERLHRLLYRRLVDPTIGTRRLHRSCIAWGCCNPHHWSPVRGRQPFPRDAAGLNLRKKVCPQGHHYTEANTYRWADRRGRIHRACRTCRKARLPLSTTNVLASDETPLHRKGIA